MTQRLATSSDGVLGDVIVGAARAARTARGGFTAAARGVASVITPLGWSIVVGVAASFLAGYTLGWAELVAIAWAGLVLIAATLLYLVGRNAHLVKLTMPVSRVVVGDRAPGLVTIQNPTRRRLPGIRVEVRVGEGIAEFAMPSLAHRSSFDDVFLVPTRRRGVVSIGPVRTVRGDPIGLFRSERVWAEQIDLFVHPRTIPIPSMSTGFIRDLEGSPTRDLTNSDVSFHALRGYVAGDERRTIHWKSTAKTGTYMVRQFEESRRSHLMVALSLADADYADEDEFEMAVSVAGSLGVRAIRDARTVSVVASSLAHGLGRRPVTLMRELSTVTRSRLLDDLSAVEKSAAALPLTELAKVAAEQVAGISVAFLVCGSTTTLSQVRAASVRFPAGVDVVAVVCEPEAVPSLRRVSELSVLTIGFLEDLQKSLARNAAV